MRSLNIKSIVCVAIAFLITVYISLTYFCVGNFNVLEFNKNLSTLFSQGENINYDKEYVSNNKSVSTVGPNGQGVTTYSYSLDLNNVPENIISVSIDFNDENISVGNIVLDVVNGDTTKSILVSNGNIRNCVKLVSVNLKNANAVSLKSSFDNFGGQIANKEMLSISEIKVNAAEDISALKGEFLLNIMRSIVAATIITIIAIVVIKSKTDEKLFKNSIKIEKLFLITALTVGVIFAFLFPVYQVPDEQTHVDIIYEELNWNMAINNYAYDFSDTLRIIRNYDQKVDATGYFNMGVAAKLPEQFALPSLMIIRHLPQATGLVLSSLLSLPVFIAFAVSELFAVAVYAVFGYFAVKLIPFKKELLTVLLLLPISLQEFPSFSYDSFVIAAFFLFFGYSLHIKFTKERFTLADFCILMALLGVIFITKIPYIFVGVLLLLIPISKIDFNFGLFRLKGEFILKHKIIFLLSALGFVAVAFLAAIKFLAGGIIGRVLLATAYSLKNAFILLVKTTIEFFGQWLVELTGNFGWFDTPVALIFTVFVIANILFFNLFDNYNVKGKSEAKNPFKPIEIIVMIVGGLAIYFVTILALFEHTTTAFGIDITALSIPQIAEQMGELPFIGGVQGRYFIPAIPMILMPLYFARPVAVIGKINHKTYLYMYHLTVFVYVGFIILTRYWI